MKALYEIMDIRNSIFSDLYILTFTIRNAKKSYDYESMLEAIKNAKELKSNLKKEFTLIERKLKSFNSEIKVTKYLKIKNKLEKEIPKLYLKYNELVKNNTNIFSSKYATKVTIKHLEKIDKEYQKELSKLKIEYDRKIKNLNKEKAKNRVKINKLK